MTIFSADVLDGLNVRTVLGMQLVLLLIGSVRTPHSHAADLYPYSQTRNQRHFICGG